MPCYSQLRVVPLITTTPHVVQHQLIRHLRHAQAMTTAMLSKVSLFRMLFGCYNVGDRNMHQLYGTSCVWKCNCLADRQLMSILAILPAQLTVGV